MQTLTKDTEQVIYEMLTENTGTHFLDSGGAYGRNWQHNQHKTLEDFRRELPVSVTEDYPEVSVFHFLNDRLTYEPELDKAFQDFRLDANGDVSDWELMDAWAFQVAESPNEIWAENSYNFETYLSQTLQFVTFIDTSGRFLVILQIHGGADVRGGYTEPRVFSADYERFAGDLQNAYLNCTQCDSRLDYSAGRLDYFEHGDACGQGCGGTDNLIPNDNPPQYGETWSLSHGCPCCLTKF